MNAVFIRHGQSTDNVGVPCTDLSTIELTELGWSQARDIAASWVYPPQLIVTAPDLRTRQTAQPTSERFPAVPVETWPIEECTAHDDGESGESFSALLRRAEAALARLAALPSRFMVPVFSHRQFIQAVRAVVAEPELDDQAKMRRFWREGEPPAIGNGHLIVFEWRDGRWHHRPGPSVERIEQMWAGDIAWFHKNRWAHRAAELRDVVRRTEGEAQEQARQALRDHFQTEHRSELTRAAMIEDARRRH